MLRECSCTRVRAQGPLNSDGGDLFGVGSESLTSMFANCEVAIFPPVLGDLRVKVWPIVLFALTLLPFFIPTTARLIQDKSCAKGFFLMLTSDEILVDQHDGCKSVSVHPLLHYPQCAQVRSCI